MPLPLAAGELGLPAARAERDDPVAALGGRRVADVDDRLVGHLAGVAVLATRQHDRADQRGQQQHGQQLEGQDPVPEDRDADLADGRTRSRRRSTRPRRRA
jgi:hypothetical protein